MKTINIKYILFIILSSYLVSCVEPINIDAGSGESQIVVEGMVKYDPDDSLKIIKDTIKISRSVSYLDNTTKPFIDNAFVTVADNFGVVDTLLNIGSGNYLTQKLKPRIGGVYTLYFSVSGESFTAQSSINRPAKFISLTTVDTTRTVGPGGPLPAGGFVKMKALDPAGAGDSYRFKFYVKRVNNPNSFFYRRDGGGYWRFYREVGNLVIASESGGGDDGNLGFTTEAPFTLPIAIAPNLVENERKYPAYFPGDSIKVEIYSITQEQLFFYDRLISELTNGSGGGFSGLFATPVTNIPSNIVNTNPNGKKALGWFGAASIARRTTVMLDYNPGNQP